jgi:AraC-like DNA-binding protein
MTTRRSPRRSIVHAPLAGSEGGARIVAWSGGDRAHERFITRTLARVARVVLCRTEPALRDEIAAGGDAIVIVEVADGTVPAVSAVVQGVKHRFPAVPVLGYCWLGPAVSAEIVACARAGLDALALRGYDDLAMMARRALARERGDEAVVLLELECALPAALQPWARVVLERAREGPNVGAVARALGCGPRTMQRAARDHGVAPPARLITSVRLLYAARLLAFRRLGVDEAALRAGYPSAVALRRAFRREGLAAPAELRTTARYAVARELLRRRIAGIGLRPAQAGAIDPASAAFAASSADTRRASA